MARTGPPGGGEWTAMSSGEAPGQIEIDCSDREPRVRFTLPQEWFTLAELRQFAKFLSTVADENEPSPEVEALAGVLETCALIGHDHRKTARAVLGWMEAQAGGIPSGPDQFPDAALDESVVP